MALAFPLSRKQVEVANELYDGMEDWRRSDAALERLRDRCPGFGPEDTLLKVVAINSLYGTMVFAIHSVARHIERLMRSPGSADGRGPELVEQIATDQSEHRIIHRYSFASKFAHFFIDVLPRRMPG